MLYENTLVIEAPLDRLWRLTTDIAAWPAFLPTVQRLERLDDGPLRVGSKARIKQPAQTEAVWTVTHLEPNREFTWETSRMGMRMTGGHHLEEVAGGVRNRLTIEVAGRGAGLFMALFGGAVRRSIREENAAFQRKATSKSDSPA
ncbi:hypothetical protein HH310_26075 [Actinoplanes sp. TBRC 11911]|uniref:SRPBCC family protein n=1 Tax=Actinoplanes sp. TBRC 11911 TaxID=2729386 RepID=UPI00145F9666|nr:SRPBCC family protein [Actinoplanes sp. TBRC 11911]NMO54640.1 hypothetical protein [Actinoplanes sp. TBRC 11911]